MVAVGAVTTANPKLDAAGRELGHGLRGRGDDGRMAGGGIGNRGGDVDALSAHDGGGHADEAVAFQELRVQDADAVETSVFALLHEGGHLWARRGRAGRGDQFLWTLLAP